MVVSVVGGRSQFGVFCLLAPYNTVAPEFSLKQVLSGSHLGGGVFWHDGGHEFF